MKPYALYYNPLDFADLPDTYLHLSLRTNSRQIRRVIRIVTVDRQTIFLYHLDTKLMYNPITLDELESVQPHFAS